MHRVDLFIHLVMMYGTYIKLVAKVSFYVIKLPIAHIARRQVNDNYLIMNWKVCERKSSFN